jgi:hypothetical protein
VERRFVFIQGEVYTVYWRYVDSANWNTITSNEPITWTQESFAKMTLPSPESGCPASNCTIYYREMSMTMTYFKPPTFQYPNGQWVYGAVYTQTTIHRFPFEIGVPIARFRVDGIRQDPYWPWKHSGDYYPSNPGNSPTCIPLGYARVMDYANDRGDKTNLTIDDWSYKLWPYSLGAGYTGPCLIAGGAECVTTFSTGDVITADECIIVTETPPA